MGLARGAPNGGVHLFLGGRLFPAPFPEMPKCTREISEASGPGAECNFAVVNLENQFVRWFHTEGFDHCLWHRGLILGGERGFRNHARSMQGFLVGVKRQGKFELPMKARITAA